MANAFLLYMPLRNTAAMVHYEETIKRPVPLERIAPHIPPELYASLRSIFGAAPIAVWGSSGGPKNRSNFARMSKGDDVLIVEGPTIRFMGKIAAKVESESLSRELWQSMPGAEDSTWDLIYFIANAKELEVPFQDFCEIMGYEKSYRLYGFTPVSSARLQQFHERFDDLYSVLQRIQEGLPVHQKLVQAPAESAPRDLVEVGPSEVDEYLETAISDHVRMQWKLARLGLKAGERVWIPVGDQARLRQAYQFNSFDSEFASGIDLPHSYVENIDVVWKKEFRIGAAYEIENSTAIYSGLLRFADLNIVAPNTLYPMFIVAPRERKHRVGEQLRRPAFQRLGLHEKVRFLSYETIDEIDTFFSGASGGLNVELIVNKSEPPT